MARVLLAMSGGVDSSVAAALLLEQGHEVVGVFMRLGTPGEEVGRLRPHEAPTAPDAATGTVALPQAGVVVGHRGCCSVGDAVDARLVADRLGIPLYVCSFRREFGRIVDHFVDEYDRGRTPNPCVRCNDWLKFGRLHDHARQVGAAFVASGHHARIVRDDRGRARLVRGRDAAKDQSYVLFGASAERREHMLLPVGELTKDEVRTRAAALGLDVADKPDSQEICFVPDDDYAGLVARRSTAGVRPGRMRHVDGRDLGAHPGHQRFTIGQRRGLGVATGTPLYVVRKDAATNEVVVGDRADLRAASVIASGTTWHAGAAPPDAWEVVRAQHRAHGEVLPARVRRAGGDAIEVAWNEPAVAVAPGQAIVLYDDRERVVGGGWIDEVRPASNRT